MNQKLLLAQGHRYWAQQIGRTMTAVVGVPYDRSKGEVPHTRETRVTVLSVCGESIRVRADDGTHLVDPTCVF